MAHEVKYYTNLKTLVVILSLDDTEWSGSRNSTSLKMIVFFSLLDVNADDISRKRRQVRRLRTLCVGGGSAQLLSVCLLFYVLATSNVVSRRGLLCIELACG